MILADFQICISVPLIPVKNPAKPIRKNKAKFADSRKLLLLRYTETTQHQGHITEVNEKIGVKKVLPPT